MNKILFPAILLLLLVTGNLFSQKRIERAALNISGNGWRVWLDKDAQFDTDTLYLPEQVNLSKAATNPPSCGWDKLYNQAGIMGKIPASFEELFGNGDALFTYHGVGWFSKTIAIPSDWKGKTIELSIEKARLRVEVYINEQLAGYDIVAETPMKIDVSTFLKTGQENHIAFRITNPGGQRGWADFPAIDWGKKYPLPPSHDFGGIGDNVILTAKPLCSISDVFVKNVLPANGKTIELQADIKNKTNTKQTIKVTTEIISYKESIAIYKSSWLINVEPNDTTFKQTIVVPTAKLWDVDHPNLYYCKVYISGKDFIDTLQERFGFRTFEAKANAKGANNYYLNGKRIRLRSAIDWGFYAQTGFYATDEMAKKSVMNAKAIGHNCLSFHRRIGEPLVMKYADELGLLIYEEPGGVPGVDKLDGGAFLKPTDKRYIAVKSINEKFRRMVVRDRNHPSVIIWNIANESATYSNYRKDIFDDVLALDNSRMLVNQSGGHFSGPSGYIPHLRPYSSIPQLTYIDNHTVGSGSRFAEDVFTSNQSKNDSCVTYWGEVACYAGPPNYHLLANIKDTMGYDHESWKPMEQKILDYFSQNDFSKNPYIKSPADFSVQAGRGLMYIDGRLSQAAMISNSNDGFAINGWSETNQSLADSYLSWYSAICDEGRNLKGPATDYAYWTKELQIAALRTNGKYFKLGDTARIDIHLINEGKLSAGKYTLVTSVTDGNGKNVGGNYSNEIQVTGGDDYAQLLINKYALAMKSSFHAGYITLHCSLTKEGKQVAVGTEQVLLTNRASFNNELKGKTGVVYHWDAAEKAIKKAGGNLVSLSSTNQPSYIVAGEVADESTFKDMLAKVKEGTTLVIRFDSLWADFLYRQKILRDKVTQWGSHQKGFWNGNGWGYIDTYIGNQAIPSKTCIGTNSWEVSEDPKGFYPFVSNYPQQSNGAFFFRPEQLLTLQGTIQYGKGKIILAPSYYVDEEQALNDLLFFKMITE